MSVINSVLKDLETRGNRFTPIDIQAVSRTAAPARGRRSLWLLAALLLVLVACGAYLFVQQTRVPATRVPAVADPVTPGVADTAPPTPAPEPAPAAAPTPAPRNQILGLQFGEDESGMRMEFVLRERAVAFLRERGEHYFSYHLRDVDSQVEAPLMRDNPWIVALEILPRGDGVDVNFETAPDVLAETRQLRGDNEVLWTVSLRRAKPAAPIAVEAPAAKPAATSVAAAEAPAASDAVTAPPAPPRELAQAPAAPNVAPPAQEPAEVRLDIRSSDPRAQSAERLAYAVELINSGRYVDAEELLRGLFDGEVEIRAREHLLALYSSLGQQDRFARLARDSMQRHAGHDPFTTEYARSLVAARAYREAVELLSARPRLGPAQHTVLAAAYQRLDRHPEAVRHYRLALEAEPADARNWVGLGISLEQTTALAEALEAYRKAGRLGQLDGRLQAFIARRSETLLQVLN